MVVCTRVVSVRTHEWIRRAKEKMLRKSNQVTKF